MDSQCKCYFHLNIEMRKLETHQMWRQLSKGLQKQMPWKIIVIQWNESVKKRKFHHLTKSSITLLIAIIIQRGLYKDLEFGLRRKSSSLLLDNGLMGFNNLEDVYRVCLHKKLNSNHWAGARSYLHKKSSPSSQELAGTCPRKDSS